MSQPFILVEMNGGGGRGTKCEAAGRAVTVWNTKRAGVSYVLLYFMQHRGLSVEDSGVFRLLNSFSYRLLVTRMSFKSSTLHSIYNGLIKETHISAARRSRIYGEFTRKQC